MLSKCPSVCLCIRLCVCVFTFEVPFNGLFAPISRSRISNIFRDSESLGKCNGKKWSQIWTFLFENCLKWPRKKKCFFLTFSTFEVPFNGLFAPFSRSRMSNIFRDLESLGKSNGKKWSNIWIFLFGSGLKSPRKIQVFFCWFCLGPPSYGIGATIRIGREMLCLPYAGFLASNWLVTPETSPCVTPGQKEKYSKLG